MDDVHFFDDNWVVHHEHMQPVGLWKRIYHFNEILACWRGDAPEIPDIDKWKINEAARLYGKTPRRKEDVCDILRLIPGEPQHKTEKTRWAYCTEFKRRTFMIYAEKWVQIIRMIAENRAHVPLPSDALCSVLRRIFVLQQGPFEMHRHTEECNEDMRQNHGARVYNCHKRFKCRHNFPDYNINIRLSLIYLQEQGHLGDEPGVHVRFFRKLKTPRKEQEFVRFFVKMGKSAGLPNIEKTKFI